MNQLKIKSLIPVAVVAFLLAGCGDDNSADSPAPASQNQQQMSVPSDDGNDTEPSSTDGDAIDTGANKNDATKSGEIVIGGQTIKLNPDIQCLIRDEDGLIAIAGLGLEDEGVSFTLDQFEETTAVFAIQLSDASLWQSGDDIQVSIENATEVKGTANLETFTGESKPASFSFNCS